MRIEFDSGLKTFVAALPGIGLLGFILVAIIAVQGAIPLLWLLPGAALTALMAILGTWLRANFDESYTFDLLGSNLLRRRTLGRRNFVSLVATFERIKMVAIQGDFSARQSHWFYHTCVVLDGGRMVVVSDVLSYERARELAQQIAETTGLALHTPGPENVLPTRGKICAPRP